MSDKQGTHVFQVTTELVLGLPEDIITPELLARQQGLFETFLEGFVALPFNFPGTGLPPLFLSSSLPLSHTCQLFVADEVWTHRRLNCALSTQLVLVHPQAMSLGECPGAERHETDRQKNRLTSAVFENNLG